MKHFRIFFLFLSLALAAPDTMAAQTQAVYDLIERITPTYSSQYELEITPSTADEADYFELGTRNGKVHIKGNNPVSIASGFNWYLKYHCKAEISWFGDQLNLPQQLPLPTALERRTIAGKYRVNFNYCTLSYTAPWWDWERWQREIDFMAMNSINTPLQPIGLDAVWYHTLLDMGLTDQEARGFLVTPGHQAWQWMTNMESYGGGLPLSWIESHKILARQIYARLNDLGMQPIQQSFTGNVPRVMMEKYPEAKIAQQKGWVGFEGVAQLDPLDPLFKRMGATFLKNQKELFGAYGMYAADPFHESKPPSDEPEYLRKVGQEIYQVIKESDPDAKVAMQSWSIRQDIAEQFPKDRLLILSLNGQTTKKGDWWGYDFVVGTLHNFGGRINMHGDLNLIASNRYVTAKGKSSSVVGSGMFMEGIVQNPIYYALNYEMPLHEGAVDTKEWLSNYAERAFGAKNESAEQALHILLETVYKKGTNSVEASSVICARPAIRVKKSGPNAPFRMPYDEQRLYDAQRLLLTDAEQLDGSPIYRFEVIDLQRQIMTNLAQRINRAAADAYEARDYEQFQLHSERFLTLLLDVDEMLASRTEWNFDPWITDARSWGTNTAEKDQFERDATELITFWGFDEGFKCMIFDYAWREWAGHIRRYYHPRWQRFYDMLGTSLKAGKPYYSEKGLFLRHGREDFRANAFYDALADWEIDYARTPKTDIDPTPRGNEVKLAKKMFEKYSRLNELYMDIRSLGVNTSTKNDHLHQ